VASSDRQLSPDRPPIIVKLIGIGAGRPSRHRHGTAFRRCGIPSWTRLAARCSWTGARGSLRATRTRWGDPIPARFTRPMCPPLPLSAAEIHVSLVGHNDLTARSIGTCAGRGRPWGKGRL